MTLGVQIPSCRAKCLAWPTGRQTDRSGTWIMRKSRGRAALPAISHCPGTRVHRLENPQVPVQLVLSRIVADRPTGADRDRTRADAVHDAIGAAQELHQIIDQLGIVEVNRYHCRRRAPELPQRGRISHCGHSQRQVN
jgi:hypothetical protein